MKEKQKVLVKPMGRLPKPKLLSRYSLKNDKTERRKKKELENKLTYSVKCSKPRSPTYLLTNIKSYMSKN